MAFAIWANTCTLSVSIFISIVTLPIFISSSWCITSNVVHFYKSSFVCVLYQERRGHILIRILMVENNTHILRRGEMTVKDEIEAGGATCQPNSHQKCTTLACFLINFLY